MQSLFFSPACTYLFSMKKWFLLLFLFLNISSLHAQETPNTTNVATSPISCSSIEETVIEVLRILSLPENERNWEDFRHLFLSNADFILISDNALGKKKMNRFNLEDFVRFFKSSGGGRNFQETQIQLEGDSYNGIAQAFQTYEVSWDGEVQQRGINAYQLVFVDGRWWIANLIWTSDANGVDIPEEYLPKDAPKAKE